MATPPRGPARSRTSSSPVRVLSVPEGIPIVCLFLSGYDGLDTHRKGRDTIPCEGPGECPSTLHRSGIIWKGYAPIHAWNATTRLWEPFVLELTESLEEELRGRNLRGEVWQLGRQGKGAKNDPVTGEYIERRDGNKIAEPFDMLPVLLRLYHVSSLRLGRPNTLPPKIVLPAVEAEAPRLPEMAEAEAEPKADERKRENFRSMREAWEQRRRAASSGGSSSAEENGKHETNGHSNSSR